MPINVQGAVDKLIYSLHTPGLHQQLINVISSFLEHHNSPVDWLSPDVLHHFYKGLPQGPCLGPFL